MSDKMLTYLSKVCFIGFCLMAFISWGINFNNKTHREMEEKMLWNIVNTQVKGTISEIHWNEKMQGYDIIVNDKVIRTYKRDKDKEEW